eukprot:gene34169-44145_t
MSSHRIASAGMLTPEHLDADPTSAVHSPSCHIDLRKLATARHIRDGGNLTFGVSRTGVDHWGLANVLNNIE